MLANFQTISLKYRNFQTIITNFDVATFLGDPYFLEGYMLK